MAKNGSIEPFEEDDFFLDEQNSNEDRIVEEEEIEEEPVVKLRPARASLTHNAIKSEILKMNKQNRNDSNEDADENLSRSARKRKKRREKILDERRASGGRNFEDDLDHFKSIPISRRRSSVLPLQTVSLPNHNNGSDGFCSKLKCCLWVLLVIGSLIGLLYIWPTVAELDLELADQATINQDSNENPILESINNEIYEGEKIINNINKLNGEIDDQSEDDKVETGEGEKSYQNNEEVSLGAFDYISSFFASEEPADTANQLVDEQQNEEQISNQQNNENNSDDNEQNIEPTTTTDDDQLVDEGFDELTAAAESNEEQINEQENENLFNNVPERYQSAVHQEDNLDDEYTSDICVIGGVNYNDLNEEQCSILQERQRQLELHLREKEQLIGQEQQENNNEEPFYFF